MAVVIVVARDQQSSGLREIGAGAAACDVIIHVLCQRLVSTNVPQNAHAAVSGRNEAVLALGEEVDCVDFVLVTFEGLCAVDGTNVPEFAGEVTRRCHYLSWIALADRQGVQSLGVPLEGVDDSRTFDIPSSTSLVAGGGN